MAKGVSGAGHLYLCGHEIPLLGSNGGYQMKYPVLFGCLTAAFTMTAAAVTANDFDDGGRFHGPYTKTPIKHLVVIFQENISYDHYFGTYPNAANLAGETPFKAKRHTPINNNLVTPLDVEHHFKPLAGGPNLLTNNPNASATAPAGPNNTRTNRPGPQRHARAGRLQQRQHGRLPGVDRHRRRHHLQRSAAAARRRRHQGPGDGLL
jgi:hypothetical protein